MPSWTPEQLKAYENRHIPSRTKPEPAVSHESLDEKAGKEGDSSRVLIRVVSYRRRLCDTDNLAPKYFIDCIRYSEIIKDDSPKFIILEVSQEKVKTKSEERTEITIEPKKGAQ